MKSSLFNTTLSRAISAIFFISFIVTGCKDKPVTPPPSTEEQELITTVKLVFTDSANNSDVRTAMFRDLDGEGGNPPSSFDTIKLQANHTYHCDIVLLDESKTPTDSVSNEVRERQNDHEFFFATTTVAIGFTYLDFDTHSPALPVGLNTKWHTGTAASGSARVVLKHQPGIKDGTIGPGESDVDLNFSCLLQ